MHFGNYRPQNTWLDKSLKNLASKDASVRDIVNGPKCCPNLKTSTFTIITEYLVGN